MLRVDRAVSLDVVRHLRAVRIPVGGIGLRGARDDALDTRRELRHDLAHRQYGVGRFRRVLPREQRVHGCPERVHVGPGIGLPIATVLFRRCEPARSQLNGIAVRGGGGRVVVAHLACDAKVYELDETVRLEHDVRGLHVAIDDRRRAAMQVAQGIAELQRPIHHGILCLGTGRCDDVFERAPLDIVHDDVERSLVVDDIDDARNRGMIEALDHVRFGHDSLYDDLALRWILDVADLLRRPLLVQHRVQCEVHRRHAAAADYREQAVPPADHALGTLGLGLLALPVFGCHVLARQDSILLGSAYTFGS